jgi:hypothetical protein
VGGELDRIADAETNAGAELPGEPGLALAFDFEAGNADAAAGYCQTNEAGYAEPVVGVAIPFGSFPDLLAFDLKREANDDGVRLELFQHLCSDNTISRAAAWRA